MPCCNCKCTDITITVPSSNAEWMGSKEIIISHALNKLIASRIINAIAKKAGINLVLSELEYSQCSKTTT